MPVKKTTTKKTTKKAAVLKKKVKVTSKKPATAKPLAKKVSPAAKITTAKKKMEPVSAKTMSAKLTKVMSKLSSAAIAKPSLKKLDAKKLLKPLIFLLILTCVYLLKDEIIVASVNGRPVTRWALIHNLEQQSASTVLENMTLQMLVEQELKKAGITVTDEEMETELSNIEEQLAAQGQNLDDLLAAQGMTRQSVKKQLALTKGMEKLLADQVTVTDEEIADYFTQNKDYFGENATLEDLKANITEQLKQEKLATEEQNWFAEIKKNANINYFKFDPNTNL
jgi:foldase protein PrsA